LSQMSPRVVWMTAPRGRTAAEPPSPPSAATSSSKTGFSLKTSLQDYGHTLGPSISLGMSGGIELCGDWRAHLTGQPGHSLCMNRLFYNLIPLQLQVEHICRQNRSFHILFNPQVAHTMRTILSYHGATRSLNASPDGTNGEEPPQTLQKYASTPSQLIEQRPPSTP